MNINIGTADRVIRVVVGLALIAFAWFYSNVPYSYLGWIGIIPILTAAIGFCPLYAVLGISTCPAGLPKSKT